MKKCAETHKFDRPPPKLNQDSKDLKLCSIQIRNRCLLSCQNEQIYKDWNHIRIKLCKIHKNLGNYLPTGKINRVINTLAKVEIWLTATFGFLSTDLAFIFKTI